MHYFQTIPMNFASNLVTECFFCERLTWSIRLWYKGLTNCGYLVKEPSKMFNLEILIIKVSKICNMTASNVGRINGMGITWKFKESRYWKPFSYCMVSVLVVLTGFCISGTLVLHGLKFCAMNISAAHLPKKCS